MNPQHQKTSLFAGKGIILILGLFIVVCGFIAFFLPPVQLGNGYFTYYYNELFSPFSISSYGMGVLSNMRYVNFAFCFLLLIGCILFIINRKEVRLIQFGAAVLLFNRVLGLCSLLTVVRELTVPFYVLPFFWLAVAIILLRATQGLRQLSVERVPGATGEETLEYVHSNRGARFLNFLFDFTLSLVFLFDGGPVFGQTFWNKMIHILGERNAILFYFIGLRVVYYLFFEAIWRATPGKFLTGSRVADFYGGKISFRQALTRTFSRLVPFEAFSFLGSGDGWHDQWSQTFVLQETGITAAAGLGRGLRVSDQ